MIAALRRETTWAVLAAAGLVVMVTGTFLPWLRSGTTTRNSYQTRDAIADLAGAHRLLSDLLDVWPGVAIACAAAVALFLVGLRILALIVAVVAAIVVGIGSCAALSVDANSYARVDLSGPIVTLIGAILVVLAAAFRVLQAVNVVAVPRSIR